MVPGVVIVVNSKRNFLILNVGILLNMNERARFPGTDMIYTTVGPS
jgi:hypothetical protein